MSIARVRQFLANAAQCAYFSTAFVITCAVGVVGVVVVVLVGAGFCNSFSIQHTFIVFMDVCVCV